ncbi:hypothetical protein DL767_000597 [Monosporascus sp. MG133]|nr:hypothetical protein DL767_000597 [Monosporascus sp. MG133]
MATTVKEHETMSIYPRTIDIKASLDAHGGDPSITNSDPARGRKLPRALRDIFLRRSSDCHSHTSQTSPILSANNDQRPPQLPSLGLDHPFRLSFTNYRAYPSSTSISSAQSHGKGLTLQSDSERESLSSRYGAFDDDGVIRLCNCLQVTASLLNKLSDEKVHGDLTPTSVMLRNFRDTLGLCSTITSCNWCTSMSDNTMLLATVACYMGKICKRVSARYESFRRAHIERRTIPPPLAVEKAGDGLSYHGISNVWFSTYHVQDDAERLQVLRSIMSVQTKDFWELLTILKGRSGENNGSLVMLAGAEAETRKARLVLEQNLPA